MTMIWTRKNGNVIHRLGYDITTKTLAVEFTDKTRKFYSPVSYSVYESIDHSTFPERPYRRTVVGIIPLVSG